MNWTIAQIASVVLCAMGSGVILSSLGHSPILGYIIAGVLLGPSCLQFITDRECVAVFSEMGILFLMFAIGLGLSFERIKNMWKQSTIVTILSTILIYIAMLCIGYILKIPQSGIWLMTFCVTLSSTAVTVKSLNKLTGYEEDIHQKTFGILIAQDIAAIVMVLIVNFMGTESATELEFYKAITLVIFLILLAGFFLKFQRFVHKVNIFIKKHGDMLTMLVFGICLGSAVISEIFGLSASFGAFIAGLVLGNSSMQDKIKNIAVPIEEILLMTFFLSIGLLVDLSFIWENFTLILSGVLFVTLGKTIINICVLRLCKFPRKESFIISVLLAHIGEFSFMLSAVASKVGIVNSYGVKFLVSLTALSLFFSPFWLIVAERCKDMTENTDISSSWEFVQQALSREFYKLKIFKSYIVKTVSTLSHILDKKIHSKK